MSALRVSDTIIVPCFYCGRDCGQDTQLVRNSGVWVPIHASGCNLAAR